MTVSAVRRERPWWAGSGSVAGTVGTILLVLCPLLVNVATSDPNRHPTTTVWKVAIVFIVLSLIVLSVNIVVLLRHPQWHLATDAAGMKWNKAAFPVAVVTCVVATTLSLAIRSGWPFLIFFPAVGFGLLQMARPNRHRIE